MIVPPSMRQEIVPREAPGPVAAPTAGEGVTDRWTIVLFHPRAAERRFRIPLSVLTLAAVLHGDHDVHIVDADLSPDPLGEIRALLRAAPGRALLGVSVMPGPQLARAVPQTAALKAEFPDVPLVWGGWFASLHAETCLRAPYIDYVMRGRTEVAFPRLLEALGAGDALEDVPNLSWRAPDGAIRHNPEAPLRHPDGLPPMPWDLVPLARYHQPTWLGSRTTGYHSSFGCPLKCGFCAVAAQYDGRWMGQSVPRMMRDIEPLLAAGANAIEFFDNNFFVSERRVRELADVLRGRGIAWWGEGTIDGLLRYADETLAAMRDSGCRMIFFGAESGSDAVLQRYNKGGLTSGSCLLLARRLARFDIVPEFSFVLGNPVAPREDIEASIALILKLKEVNPLCEIILYLYSPEPYGRSELWEEARRRGFRFPERLEDWAADGDRLFKLRRTRETPWLEAADVDRVHHFETVLNAYHPGVSDIRLGRHARRLLRVLAAPRYRLRLYHRPVLLELALRVLHHRRVEQEGL